MPAETQSLETGHHSGHTGQQSSDEDWASPICSRETGPESSQINSVASVMQHLGPCSFLAHTIDRKVKC